MDSGSRDDVLGVVTEGSFSAGLTVRLNGNYAEDLQVGSFVVLEGTRERYFSLINDLQLRTTDPTVVADPPVESAFIRSALQGIHTFTAATVRPSLVVEDKDSVVGGAPRAVRTIPSHFAQMRRAREEDFDVVFGHEGDERFSVGAPIAMDDVNVTIDLRKLVERPSGIFGQTGTGKSVLTRLILFGLIRSDIASALIFDMHDEYADARPDKQEIPGLRDLFGATEVKVYGLDRKAPRVDYHIQIGMNHIEPEDIELLRDELDLTDTFSATTFLLRKVYGKRWLSELLNMDAESIKEFVERTGAHEGAIDALRRKLMYLSDRDYIVTESSSDPVRDIVHHLQGGRHVIVQFGRWDNLRDYMLVANLLTRRIHEQYREAADKRRTQMSIEKGRSLVVVLEEAHKFLSPSAARQSIFGIIAREMRKFDVSLMVVDQRPSQIDSEVMSQLATRISGLLTDEHDIGAVLSGTSDRSGLRSMLASLEPTQQCLVVGHAIPMPMVVRTRKYSRELRDDTVGRKPVDNSPGLALLRGGRPGGNS